MAAPKIEISLTDFIDFVSKSGTPKLTKVKTIKYRPEYHPSSDFYKAFREKLIAIHKMDKNKASLDTILNELTDEKKKANYPAAIKGYKKFWGSKKIKWFEPPSKKWAIGDLQVSVNPELGLVYGDKLLVIKLYLKSERLSKDKISQILALLEKRLRRKDEEEITFGVLDVKNGKLFTNDSKDISLMPLLEGEARSFETIWKSLK